MLPKYSKDVCRKLAALLILTSIPGYIYCGLNHICMDGHMAHPPYSILSVINDFVWVIGLTLAALSTLKSNLALRRTVFSFLIYLLTSRLLLGSGGGVLFIIELPIIIFVVSVAIRGLARPGKDWLTATEVERQLHRKKIKRRWLVVIVGMTSSVLICWAGITISHLIRESLTEKRIITNADVPFKLELVFTAGKAIRFELPNGKRFAVWCERNAGFGEQATACGLKTAWGEKPFVRPELLWNARSDGSQESAGWKSYITQGGVTTKGDKTTEYEMFVDQWRISIVEDLQAKTDLPVVIQVALKPSS